MPTPASLPPGIALYFDLSNGADDVGLARAFTEDATVRDEGRTHVGLTAIRAWLRQARSAFSYQVAPQAPVSASVPASPPAAAPQDTAQLTVPAAVTGNFPGSPVVLEHRFRLQGGRIQSLEIS